jgi:hypothetical protein
MMLRLIALIVWLLPALPAQAFWQSRDSNYSSSIGGVGPPAAFIQVAAGTGVATNSGSPNATTSSAAVPVGSTIVMAVNVNGVANQDISSCADNATVGGAPNTYVVLRPTATAGVNSGALCYVINTTRDIPIGSAWTIVTAGGAQYNMRGAWYITGYNGGIDKTATVNQATPGTAVAGLATTTLSNIADVAVGYVVISTTATAFSESPLFTNLFNNTFNNIGYDAVTSTAALTYAPTWLNSNPYSAVLLTLLPTGAGGGCAEATTFLARTSGLSGTQTSAYTNLICGLVTDGIWSKLDGLYVYATNTTTTANLNLKSTSFTSTVHGTCTFTANAGYTGDGTTCYQDTGWSPNGGGTQYALNGASIGACSLTARTPVINTSYISTIADVVAFNDWTDITANSTGSWTFGVNSGFISASPGGTTQGSWIAVRSTAALVTLYHNGVSTASGTDASGALSSQHGIVMARNRNAVIQNFNPDQFAYALFGGLLVGTDVANFHNRMHTYLSAVGAPAGC